jgi:hypothetical protein
MQPGMQLQLFLAFASFISSDIVVVVVVVVVLREQQCSAFTSSSTFHEKISASEAGG